MVGRWLSRCNVNNRRDNFITSGLMLQIPDFMLCHRSVKKKKLGNKAFLHFSTVVKGLVFDVEEGKRRS